MDALFDKYISSEDSQSLFGNVKKIRYRISK